MLIILSSCKNNEWDEHYKSSPVTINMNVWEALQQDADLSLFVRYMKKFKYDTLFLKDNTYSLFAPTNYAFSQITDTASIDAAAIAYHISTFFVKPGNIKGKRKIETLDLKFALFDNTNFEPHFDEIALDFESPLYKNGKYFKMAQVAVPKPSLYEYIAITNPVLLNYIDSKDSVILDKELSKPIGFDDFGNTIYDTVSVKYNKFEAEYFEVSKEFRFQTATLVFPREEDYNTALTNMAQSLGGNYINYQDIPLIWQNEILIPYLLEHGVFENMVEPVEFTIQTTKDTVKMKNIKGDSIIIKYLPTDKTLCSNGYAYNYTNFAVPDTLFSSKFRFEAEDLLKETGLNKFSWYENVSVSSSISFAPAQEFIASASNDSIAKVNFPKGYTGDFTLEFNVDNLFPRKYLMVFRTNVNLGGIYDIYVNDVLVKTFDYYDYVKFKDVYRSVTGTRHATKAGYNIFDCYVESILDFGITKIKIDYTAPGKVLNNGFSLDYIEFIPQ